MADVLLYGDTERSAALRHEIPVAIGDPFLYAEVGGRTYIMSSNLERDRLAAARPGAELLDVGELGFYELLKTGLRSDEVATELVSRAAAATGVRQAIVDYEFALGVAERLQRDGIALTVDDGQIKARRRAKSKTEMEGIVRAQRAAEAGMAAAAARLRQANVTDGTLYVDGQPLLAEHIRETMRDECWRHGAVLPPEVIVASVWQGAGHEPGSGPLPARLPIEVDLWPRDETTGCWADMTRTFVIGEPVDRTRRQERLVRQALQLVRTAVKPGVLGSDLHGLTCELFEGAGYRTQRTGPGQDPNEGFQFSVGHGVGLELHEAPTVGLSGHEALVVGDVLAIEPGLWDAAVGGVRFEDLVVVTPDGCQTLTEYPYELTP